MNKTISKLLVFFLAFTMIVGMHIVDAAPGSNNGKGSDKSNSSNNSPNSPHLKNDTDTKGHDPKQDDKDGITITNLEPGKEYEVKVTAPGKKGDTLNETTKVTADENGNAIISVEGETSNPGGVYYLEVDGVKSKNFKVKDDLDKEEVTEEEEEITEEEEEITEEEEEVTEEEEEVTEEEEEVINNTSNTNENNAVVLSEDDTIIPQGAPQVQEAPVEASEETTEEPNFEIADEPAPQAAPTLPATGAGSSALFSGLGTILMGLGLALKKRF